MIRLPLIVLLSSLTVLSSAPVRGACTDGPEVCVDGPGSKFINGVEVWRECWNYQTTRHCTSSSTVDYCSGLKQTPGCRQTKAECLSYSLTEPVCLGTVLISVPKKPKKQRTSKSSIVLIPLYPNGYDDLFKFLRQSRLLYRRREMYRRS